MKINIKGPIVSNNAKWIYEEFDMEATCPNDVINQLDEAPNENAEVIINSGGGSVYDASEIYTALRSHGADVQTVVVGLAASAASVIAMAGNTLSMSPTAKMMIHNASTIALGDYREMDKTSELLQTTNKAIASSYRAKSGMAEDELLDLMDKETWLTAEDAKEYGLIDEIMFENDGVQMVASASTVSNTIPQQVINKLRDDKATAKNEQPNDNDKNSIKGMNIELKLEESEMYKDFMNEMSEVKRYLVNAGLVDEKGNETEESEIKNQKEPEPEKKSGFSRFLF